MPCIYCQICEKIIDLDFDVEHEEECKEYQNEKERLQYEAINKTN